MGYTVQPLNVNTSGTVWEINETGDTLIQPLTSIKGLGDKAIEQIIDHRPFNTIEEFLFHDKIVYSKLNKKSIHALTLSQAMNDLVDDRFTGLKHFWTAVAEDRPRKEKNLIENIEKYAPEGDFSEEEKLEYLVNLTGVFPINAVVTPRVRQKLDELYVPPISEFDPSLGVTWFIPRECKLKKSKNGKNFYVVKVIDDNNETVGTEDDLFGQKEIKIFFITNTKKINITLNSFKKKIIFTDYKNYKNMNNNFNSINGYQFEHDIVFFIREELKINNDELLHYCKNNPVLLFSEISKYLINSNQYSSDQNLVDEKNHILEN